jgi:hypothetical protein
MDHIVPARASYPKFRRLDRDPLTGLCLVPPIPLHHACSVAAAYCRNHPPCSTHLPHSHSWLTIRPLPSSGASLPPPASAPRRSPFIPRSKLVRSALGWADAEHIEPQPRSGTASADWFRSRRAMRACPHFDTVGPHLDLATPSWLRPGRMARATSGTRSPRSAAARPHPSTGPLPPRAVPTLKMADAVGPGPVGRPPTAPEPRRLAGGPAADGWRGALPGSSTKRPRARSRPLGDSRAGAGPP